MKYSLEATDYSRSLPLQGKARVVEEAMMTFKTLRNWKGSEKVYTETPCALHVRAI